MANPTIIKGFTWTAGATVMPTRLNQEVDSATLNFDGTDQLAGRSTAGAGPAEAIPCTAAGRAVIAGANAAAQRTTLGVTIGTDVQAFDADLAAIAAIATTSYGRAFLALADAAAARTAIGAVIGTDVQAYDADLAAIASLATTTYGRSLLTQADAAAARATIGGNAVGTRTVSVLAPSGGSDGDLWLQV